MNKELVEKMKTAYKDRGENPIGIFQLCAAVASEHYGDKWTRVEDGLPEKDGLYIIAHFATIEKKGIPTIETAMYTADTKSFMATFLLTTLCNELVINFHNVTHWMHIPQPPQQ